MLFQQKSDDQKPRRTHSRRSQHRTHSQWSHSWRFRWFPFTTISTISTIPIGDDLDDSDSHGRRSIRDDSQRFLTIRTLHDDSWQFGPFVTIPKSSPPSNDSSPPTARRFASLRRRLCLESISFFFFFFHFMFICLGSRTGGKTRIGINSMFSYEYCCCVLFWFAGW